MGSDQSKTTSRADGLEDADSVVVILSMLLSEKKKLRYCAPNVHFAP
jgi:hypothetical protein